MPRIYPRGRVALSKERRKKDINKVSSYSYGAHDARWDIILYIEVQNAIIYSFIYQGLSNFSKALTYGK